MFKLKLKKDAEKVQLLQAAGSRDATKSMQAQEMLAAEVGPIIQQVLDQLATSNLIYEDYEYDFDTVPSIPLDLFDGNEEGMIDIWSQSVAGGLPSNMVWGMSDFRMTTYRLDSAIHFLKRYAKDARLDVVSLAIRRMVQEVLVKQENNAWAVVLKALAEARTNSDPHVINATAANVFQLDDLNRLWTKIKRFRRSWTGGTPTSVAGRGLTDLIVSPEMVEQIRGFAYQPMNTRAVTDTNESTAVPLPDSMREKFFSAAGVPEIFGVNIIELQELGVGQGYNSLFDAFYTPSGSDPTFDGTTQELLIGVDNSIEAFIRTLATDPDSQSSFITEVDDQWVKRSEKMGWFGFLEEGRACIDSKAVCGIIV